MTHYVCPGTCHGVSDTPKACSTQGCTHFGEDLKECNCTDGKREEGLSYREDNKTNKE